MALRNQPPLDFAAWATRMAADGSVRSNSSRRLEPGCCLEQTEDVSKHLGKEQLVSRLDQPNPTTYITSTSRCQEFAEAMYAVPIVEKPARIGAFLTLLRRKRKCYADSGSLT